jgi:hypothetical protein
MRRLSLIFSLLTAGIGTACLTSTAPGPQAQIPYAVVYGRIGAPIATANIQVIVWAYTDSLHAVEGGDSAGFAGAFDQAVDSTMNYFTAYVEAAAPGTFFLDIFATGQGHTGYVSSVDTIRAIRARFDTLNGGPHDSIAVYDSLP